MSPAPSTVRDALYQALLSAAKFNGAVQAAPAAVLWTDPDAIWRDTVPSLQASLPGLLTFGDYDPEHRTGPAIWLKCAIAGTLPEVHLQGQVPILYMPGVSRADLRAIESCPRALQPLAELQYRGVFWSQENAKDWTINAFLVSRSGGLGLAVAKDAATQDALLRALTAGVLLDRPVAELRARQINAEWLDSLLAPNPARDILVWLNDPKQAEQLWAGAHWDVFTSRCRKDFSFDPTMDGELVAAEKLTTREGNWTAVWEVYTDSYMSFPRVVEQIDRVRPPASRNLFDDLSSYSQVNADAEDTLRTELTLIGKKIASDARAALLSAENGHAARRDWLWARMGRAPLAQALNHLAQVAQLSQEGPGGATIEQMSEKYRSGAWRVDAEAMRALAAVHAKADSDAVSAALRAVYVPWLENTAVRFQEAAVARGGLHANGPVHHAIADGVCVMFVDGLRYDVAVELQNRLQAVGQTSLDSAWTCIPSLTASGKAWASPVAHLIAGTVADDDFKPRVAATGKTANTQSLRNLLAENGFQVLDKDETGDPTGKAWVECGDLDHYGHEHGIRLARDLSTQLDQIAERITELADAGWTRVHVVTDHGWLLVPGGLPKAELPMHEAQARGERAAVLKETAAGTPLTFGWDWCKEVQVAVAPGIAAFRAGLEYAHGGLSLQECLVPVLDIDVADSQKQSLKLDITAVAWKGLRCYIEVTPAIDGLSADVRTKAAQADSSVVAKMRAIEGGKASLAVADDDLIGTAAVVVVLDANGAVVQKLATTVGG